MVPWDCWSSFSGFPQATPGPRSWRGLKIKVHSFPPTKVPTRARESIADILGVSAVAATAGMNQHMHEYLYQYYRANQGRIRADSMRSNPRVVEQSYGHVQHITRLTQTGLEGREVLLDGAHNRPKFEIARSREI